MKILEMSPVALKAFELVILCGNMLIGTAILIGLTCKKRRVKCGKQYNPLPQGDFRY